ncbi:McrC family protein [Psychrobacter sp. SZ93C1]|uniref:McrC family protein n=1 Tax=Psychrobacter sp. SZ93C1 TaxID=2792058 RepID=UPI001D12C72B|nr:McrC family protein [Psychrobacter sp. SZ93C1]
MINSDGNNQVLTSNSIDRSGMGAPDTNVITVFEHQRLTADNFLQIADFHWLMAQEFSVFSIKRQQGQWQLKVGHYIGIILLPSGMVLEILPKLNPSIQDSNLAQTRQWVQGMMSDLIGNRDRTYNKLPHTKNLGQFSTQLTSLPIAALPLSDWLVTQFLQRLAQQQPTLHYQSQTHNQASLQGRLLIKEQLRHNSMQPHKFFCESSVLSQDMLGNRLIKSALMLLSPLLSQSMTPKSLQAWQPVLVLSQHEMQRLDSMYHQAKQQLAVLPLHVQKLQTMQQLVDLAYWLLQQSNTETGHMIDPSKASKHKQASTRLCLLIDMNQAFEQWVSQRIASMFSQVSPNYRPLYQAQSIWLSDTEGQACLSIRPDLLIYKTAIDTDTHADTHTHQGQDNTAAASHISASGSYSHVIDIKWKHLSHAASISASDAYQLTSYAQAYQADQVWLVYPVQGDERQPIALSQRSLNGQDIDNNMNSAQLWLIPFNVFTGTINERLCSALNRV